MYVLLSHVTKSRQIFTVGYHTGWEKQIIDNTTKAEMSSTGYPLTTPRSPLLTVIKTNQ